MFKLGKCTGNYAKFKYARNKFVAKLCNAKEKLFANLDPRDQNKFWKTVKYLNNSAVSIPTLFHNDTLVASDKGKANLLNSFFSTCFNTSHPPLSNDNQCSVKPIECCEEILCTVEEVEYLLSNLSKCKATGPDGVSDTMLKYTVTNIAPSVTKLFNLSIKSVRIPMDWKQSLVVPIPKASAMSSPNNYCPISLLSTLSKLLERHMYMLISSYLSEHHILSSSQYGFSPGKGTVTALLTTTDNWFKLLEEGNGCAILFDYRKAFDSVPHQPLLDKLLNLGLDKTIFHWVENYLTLRYQKVAVNGSTSDCTAVLSGVPQGSVLGIPLNLVRITSHSLCRRSTTV